ncbi:MAG TPA: hypothetical protein VLC92_06025 [Rhodocyclaceae bacterium]|nr:hypothetical protein [Rhodocyclaceae bacterium]
MVAGDAAILIGEGADFLHPSRVWLMDIDERITTATALDYPRTGHHRAHALLRENFITARRHALMRAVFMHRFGVMDRYLMLVRSIDRYELLDLTENANYVLGSYGVSAGVALVVCWGGEVL